MSKTKMSEPCHKEEKLNLWLIGFKISTFVFEFLIRTETLRSVSHFKRKNLLWNKRLLLVEILPRQSVKKMLTIQKQFVFFTPATPAASRNCANEYNRIDMWITAWCAFCLNIPHGGSANIVFVEDLTKNNKTVQRGARSRFAKLGILPAGYGQNGIVYLSELFAFNFLSTNYYVSCNDCVMLRLSPFERDLPKADVLKVAIVKSPLYDDTEYIGHLLRNYFSQERILRNEDVFMLEDDESVSDSIVLKVVSIKNKEFDNECSAQMFTVCSTYSTLFQVASVNSFIPRLKKDASVNSPFWLNENRRGFPAFFKNYANRISSLVEAAWSIQSCGLCILLYGAEGCGKRFISSLVASYCRANFCEIDCYELLADSVGASEAKLRTALAKVENYWPCILLLRNVDVLGMDLQTGEVDPRIIGAIGDSISRLLRNCQNHVAIIATCSRDKSTKISTNLAFEFLYEIEVTHLTELDRFDILTQMMTGKEMSLDLRSVARRTAGCSLADLHSILKDSHYFAYLNESTNKEARNLIQEDIDRAIEQNHRRYADAIGAPKIPNVDWTDIGGLDEPKRVLLETVQLSIEKPHLFVAGLRRSGILLYGPPGCGKTLLAKAVASQCHLTFLSVKGPELLNMYVGQSEANVREVFSRARSAAPCVIFFDELDSLAPKRGASGDSAGVMDRVVSQLLAELDGVSKNGDLFVIGATNRPDLIDNSLLRPGRFDKLVYVGIGGDFDSRYRLLKAVTRKMNLADCVDLAQIINMCPSEGLSGADFHSLAVGATRNAISRLINDINADKNSTVTVRMDDFTDALRDLKPSVSPAELHRYSAIKDIV